MIDWATNLVASGGLVGVFLLMVAENLFPPIPSEVIMSLAGFAAARGDMSLLAVIVAGVAGAVVGNAAWYEAARAFGAARTRRLLARFGRYVGIGMEDVNKAELTMRRYGPVACFIGRFMPGVRTAISVPAGLVELPRRVFYLWTTLGTAIWTSGLAIAGYLLRDQFARVEAWTGPIGLGVTLVVAALIGWQVLRALRNRRSSAATSR
jgi:membrane protein DedA with SNARE-associated domain